MTPAPPNSDVLSVLLDLVRDIASKVDALASDHVTRGDLDALRAYIDGRLDRQADKQYSRDEVDARLRPLEDSVKELRQLALSETQRMLALIGGGLGIVSTVIVLAHLIR